MPRTVLVGVISSLLYGVAALAFLPGAASRLVSGTGSERVSDVVSVVALAFLVLHSISTARGLVLRREQARKHAFVVGFGMALVQGVLVLMLVVMAIAERLDLWVIGLMMAVWAPSVAIAWALSRRSVKAWFASTPPRDQATRK